MTIPIIHDYPMPSTNSFPANRTEWRVDPDRAVLLLHDMQCYFLRFYEQDSGLVQVLTGNLARVRAWAYSHSIPVIYTAQPHEQAPEDRALLNDMWGPGLTGADPSLQEIVSGLSPSPGDTVLAKWRYSAFQRTDLLERMRRGQRDQLILGGVYASVGCMVTAVDAFMNDIKPFMIGDAVADFSERDHHLALQYVATRCGSVVDTAGLVRQVETVPDCDWLEKRIRQFIEDEAEIDAEENLIFYGLDSLQVMRIAGELQGRGIDVGFDELARTPTLNAWRGLIGKKRPAADPRRSQE